MKGKALRRALETSDVIRVGSNIPLLVDTTELVSPAMAQEMLKRNRSNRPVNWKKVEEYSTIMRRGGWELHSQGIIFDADGNLLTGQTRLWAVVYSGVNVYLRISKGNSAKSAKLIDRGRPQSARDLASRETDKKHSPVEASIARGLCALHGNLQPSLDDLAAVIANNTDIAAAILRETAGTKKTKAILMVLAAICSVSSSTQEAMSLAKTTPAFADNLERALKPQTAALCWGKGAAFGLALKHARDCVRAGV
jgi:hypothetical protein